MKEMTRCIQEQDFQGFAQLTMKDSNQFHATCLDTFPPISYLNDTSRHIIQLVHRFNTYHGQMKVTGCGGHRQTEGWLQGPWVNAMSVGKQWRPWYTRTDKGYQEGAGGLQDGPQHHADVAQTSSTQQFWFILCFCVLPNSQSSNLFLTSRQR